PISHHGRRRADAAPAWREGGGALGAFPDLGLLSPDRRDRKSLRDPGRHHSRDADRAQLGKAGAGHRPRSRRQHGSKEAGGIFLMLDATTLRPEDTEAYLLRQSDKDLLRFITCGSVDDGKSTLIGRLLFDSKQIFEDQLAALGEESRRWGTTGEEMDLALLVDGLAAEREQGITIDVAYRF